ncbi:MAG TPA: malic enzyme-like NAD(P)-binding protein [Actinomycetota bacterium]|nr:malic enzyme-like NAD(P)-binding protein [Actinomycetota bacterium]
MAQLTPSAGHALTMRVNLRNTPGTLGRLTTAIGEAGGDIGAVDLVEHRGGLVVRDIAVKARDEAHAEAIVRAARAVDGVEVRSVHDRTFEIHRGGKISIAPKFPVRTRDDLSMAYTPGVGRISRAIADDVSKVWEFTHKGNAVAVLTDGSAVLGLGNIGPEAALPVMEGKAMLFKEFADVDAYPLCVRADGPNRAEKIVEVAKAIAPGFGGINLEDIAAPECFDVEERLAQELDIPVFHDDQHGTAVVVLAALLNACRATARTLAASRVVFLGAGAAGVACAKLLLHVGVGDVIVADRAGIIHPARVDNMNEAKRWLAVHTNRDGIQGSLADALKGADGFVGVSGPGLVAPDWVEAMADDAILFALSNPVPEIMPEEVPSNVRVVATGRSDYTNQINNVLVFPGFFRGLLDSRARTVTDTMKVAAAEAIAAVVGPDELSEEYIVPSVFDRRVAPSVAAAVESVVGS